MTAQKDNSYRRMWVFGLAFTLPIMILCGGLAGYFSSVVLVQHLGLPGYLTPALIGLGLVISGLKAFSLVQRLNVNSNKQK